MYLNESRFSILAFILFFGSIHIFQSTMPEKLNYKAPASITSGDKCMVWLRPFLKGDLFGKQLNQFDVFKSLPAKYKKLYRQAIIQADLNDGQIEAVFKDLFELPAKVKQVEIFEAYLKNVKTYFAFNRIKGFNDTHLIFTEEGMASKEMKEFSKRLKRFQKHEEKQFKKHMAKLSKESPGNSPSHVRKAKQMAKTDNNQYRKMYNGCHTKGMTEEHAYGGKTFTYFTVGLSAASSAVFYTAANYDDEEFGTKEFFGKLSYEMVGDMLWALAASYIFKDPKGSFFAKTVKMYATDNVLVGIDAIVWDMIFGDDQAAAEDKLRTLVDSPTYREDVEKLIKVLNDKSFVTKVKDNFFNVMDKFKENPDPKFKIDWDKLSEESLKDPKIREELVKGILQQEYDGDKGDYIETGSYAADRYLYYSLLGLPFMFADTMISLKIYQTLCMGRANPGIALGKAMLMFSAYSMFYDSINYPLRKEAIGQ